MTTDNEYTGNEYTGPRRRHDDNNPSVSTRLALVENHIVGLKEIVISNKKGNELLHAKFTQFDHEQKAELRISVAEILEKLDKKEEACAICKSDIKTLQVHHGYTFKWLIVLSTGVAGLFGWHIKGH